MIISFQYKAQELMNQTLLYIFMTFLRGQFVSLFLENELDTNTIILLFFQMHMVTAVVLTNTLACYKFCL